VYVSAVSVAEQWEAIGSNLPDGWARAQLRLELRDRETTDAAAALLAPTSPYRAAPTVLLFGVARDGSAASPESIARLLRRLTNGTLELSGSQAAAPIAEKQTTTLAEGWDALVAGLPADWSDLYVELEFISTDFIERASVLCVQCNPRRDGARAALRFRCARVAGYGVSASMARRCLERCDGESIRGTVTALRVLSGSRHVATQGPVWLAAGKTI
jgi:hypothetical protein